MCREALIKRPLATCYLQLCRFLGENTPVETTAAPSLYDPVISLCSSGPTCLLLFVYDSMGYLLPSQDPECQVMAEATIVNHQPVAGTGEVLRQHLFLDLFFLARKSREAGDYDSSPVCPLASPTPFHPPPPWPWPHLCPFPAPRTLCERPQCQRCAPCRGYSPEDGPGPQGAHRWAQRLPNKSK